MNGYGRSAGLRTSFLARLAVWIIGLAFFSSIAAAVDVSSSELRQLKKDLAKFTKDEDGAGISRFVTKLSKMDDPDTVPLLVEAAVALPSFKNYETAVKAIARFTREPTIKELVTLSSKSKDFRQRNLIFDAFGKRKDEQTLEAILKGVRDDKVVQGRVGAIRACIGRKDKAAIPVLIDHVEKHAKNRNRDWIEARQALLELTAQDFESVGDWRKFWEGNKDGIDPKNLDREDGPTKVVVRRTKDSIEFFGGEILSQNVVFVIDCSGSMIAYDEDPEYTGDDIEYDRRRLERAKDQTYRAIRKLKSKSKFNIITYNSQTFVWQKKGIVPASPSTLLRAKKFIQAFQANGLTHTDEALEKAFDDPRIDTIVLLSDGAPQKDSGGNAVDLQKKILERVKDLNASRKLRIDTFGFEGEGKLPKARGGGSFGGGAESILVKFLKKLAGDNGGNYSPIK